MLVHRDAGTARPTSAASAPRRPAADARSSSTSPTTRRGRRRPRLPPAGRSADAAADSFRAVSAERRRTASPAGANSGERRSSSTSQFGCASAGARGRRATPPSSVARAGRSARPAQNSSSSESGRELGGAAVELAGLLGAPGGQQLVGRAGELVGALERRAAGAARRAGRRGPRRAGRRVRRHGSPSARHDDQRRRLAPAHVAALGLGGRRARPAAGRRGRRRAAANAARHRGRHGVARPSCSPGSVQCSPATWPACAMQSAPVCDGDAAARVDDRRPGARAASGSAASSAAERLPARRRPPPSRSSAFGPCAGSTTDCVATAPTPGRAQAHSEPTENQCDWTATPSSPVARVERDDRIGRRRRMRGARIPVTARPSACSRASGPHRPGLRARLRRRLPGRAALRRHRAVGTATTRPCPWHRIVRADGSLAKGARQRALLEAEGVPFRGERVDMRAARLPD